MKERTADIFADFERIRERMERAWRQVLGPPGSPRFCPPVIEPAADVYETEREVVVVVEMAGISEGDVDITVDGRKLVVNGERKPNAGRPGRIYYEEANQWIDIPIIDTATGNEVGRIPYYIGEGDGEIDPTGSFYYHCANNDSNARITKYDIRTDTPAALARARFACTSAEYFPSRLGGAM